MGGFMKYSKACVLLLFAAMAVAVPAAADEVVSIEMFTINNT